MAKGPGRRHSQTTHAAKLHWNAAKRSRVVDTRIVPPCRRRRLPRFCGTNYSEIPIIIILITITTGQVEQQAACVGVFVSWYLVSSASPHARSAQSNAALQVRRVMTFVLHLFTAENNMHVTNLYSYQPITVLCAEQFTERADFFLSYKITVQMYLAEIRFRVDICWPSISTVDNFSVISTLLEDKTFLDIKPDYTNS